MSQLVGKHKNGNTIRFGLDHAIGWFYTEENAARLIELLQANLTRECLQRLQPAINNIAMDLDPQCTLT